MINSLIGSKRGTVLASKSVRFNSADSAHFTRTPGVAGNRKTWTYSTWVKKCENGREQALLNQGNSGLDDNGYLFFEFDNYDRLTVWGYNTNWRTTNAYYRDPTAWMHICLAFDTTASAADRVKLYVNGAQVTSFLISNDPVSGADTAINAAAAAHLICRNNTVNGFNGYIADTYLVDGLALTPDNFAETNATTNQWVPKLYVGSLGTCGCHLDFSDGSTATALGYDAGTGTNDWTVNNISVVAGASNDWLDDSPINNYAVRNCVDSGGIGNLRNGSLDFNPTGTNTGGLCRSTIGVAAGKWYAEATLLAGDLGNGSCIGIIDGVTYVATGDGHMCNYSNSLVLYYGGVTDIIRNTVTVQTGLGAMSNGDVVGLALDMDAKTLQIYRNGATLGTAESFTGAIAFFASTHNVAANGTTFNFGQRAFANTPPAGFLALCTRNLTEPIVVKSNTAFDAKKVTGIGGAASIKGLAFQPDVAWIKSRSAATDHALYDSVRGVQKDLVPNSTSGAETTEAQGVQAFNTDGISVGTLAKLNTSGAAYIDWFWRKGATYGVDVVTYVGNGVGRTIAHGLGVAPKLYMTKDRAGGYGWRMYHKDLTAYYAMDLSSGAAKNAGANQWNNTEPASDVFSIGSDSYSNESGHNYVCYLFSEVAGFSKIGSYIGNGSTNGPFVWCGFKPRWLIIKRTDDTSSWMLIDAARDSYNPAGYALWSEVNNAESNIPPLIDFTATGFKYRDATYHNTNGATYIFMAYAEAPFKYNRAENTVPANTSVISAMKSVRFNSADSSYMNRTPAAAGNRKTWTYSCWVKKSALGVKGNLLNAYASNSDAGYLEIAFDTVVPNALVITAWSATYRRTTQVFRDPAAWYHLVVAVDTTQATADNRIRLYVNGLEVTSFSTSSNPAQNFDTQINNAVSHRIGSANPAASTTYLDGYLADVFLIDGQALTPSSFAETDAVTGQWKPKVYAGNYGTNGFHLDFSQGASIAALGYSDNGNHLTVNNISITAGVTNDWLADSPSNNYCTLTPLQLGGTGDPTNGNLDYYASSWKTAGSTQHMATGKWYWEVDVQGTTCMPGIVQGNWFPADGQFPGNGALSASWYSSTGQIWQNGGGVFAGSTFTTGDTLGFAFDADAGTLYCRKAEAWQNSGDPVAGTGSVRNNLTAGPYQVAIGTYAGTCSLNTGQRAFKYTVPNGYNAICTDNLTVPAIVKSNTAFDAKLRTGTGATANVTVAFQPDLAWIKSRSAATDHALYDSVRGVQKRWESNTNDPEVTSDGGVTAFNSDGVTIGTLAQANTNAATYVDWLWKKGATYGMDIVGFTGTGVAHAENHSLGVVPEMMILKNRITATQSSCVYHKNMAATPQNNTLFLDTTGAAYTHSSYWNNTVPSSTQFTVGTAANTNENAKTMIAYLFASIPGFSKIGSYVGNGATDGPFVWCGFRPKLIITKRADTTSEWYIIDSLRKPYNGFTGNDLLPNRAYADSPWSTVDYLANGFKIRWSDADHNYNGGTYIFAAFAEAPFKYARGR